MNKTALLLIAVCALALTGCATGEVGKSQTDQAYPTQSEDDVRATLAKENPEALKAYEEGQARDRAVEAQNKQAEGDPGQR